MVARVWRGTVPREKAEDYGKYLSDSDRGVRDYRRVPGNRGVCLLRRDEGDRAHFLLISFWDSRAAIEGYAGQDIDKAQYFPYDRECLLDPEPTVAHYDVLVAPGAGAPEAGAP
jgi:heme-degrading monooxygenase HmoA